MLVTVVEEEEVRAESVCFPRGFHTALRDHDEDAGELPRERDRFVAAFLR
jgi:hypothetical protein